MRPSDSTSCPSAEWLIAHLAATLDAGGAPPAERAGAGLTPAEHAAIDDHLHACDRCVETLTVAHHRLRIASELPAPLPVALRVRTEGVNRSPDTSPWWSTWARVRAWLPALLKFPVLIPAAVTVGILLVVAGHTWMQTVSHCESTRAVRLRQTLRVTAGEALVRAQPSTHADVVAKVTRGDIVEIGDEERDWYRVIAPNSAAGWVERRAFQ